MFNLEINDLDKKIWEEELNDFVPKKVYDVHTHIYQWQSNLDINKKPTMESVNRAYIKIQKKIHPDISPETARLSTLVNEAKEIVIKDIS